MLIDIAFITVYNTVILEYETTSGHKKKYFKHSTMLLS